MEKLKVDLNRNRRIRVRVASTRDILILIGRLRRNHENLNALIGAIADCAVTHHFPEDETESSFSFLKTYRDMMASPPSTEAESLACFDRLWVILRRTQAGLLS
jgi:hypothetical protein